LACRGALLRCRHCSEHQGRPFKGSHLVALRTTKISANTRLRSGGRESAEIEIDRRTSLRRPGSRGPQARSARRQHEKINAPFLFTLGGKGSELGAGIRHAVEKGWLELHESGTHVRLLRGSDHTIALSAAT